MTTLPKIWTATDVKMGKLTINQEGSLLTFERRYLFLDSNGDVLDQIAGGRVVEQVEWADVPANIQAALQAINTWTKNKALAQEGMSGA